MTLNTDRLDWKPKPGRKAGKLGALPVHAELYGQVIRFKSVLNTANLPSLPASYNVQNALGVTDTNMDGNDQYGDCAEAMSAHMERCFQRYQTGSVPVFSTQSIVAQYLTETGGQDTGLDMLSHCTYWRDKGLLLDGVNRDQIDEFVTLDLSNDTELLYSIYLLSGAACGLAVPQSAMNQFDAGQPWDVATPDGGVIGYHAVAMLAFDSQHYYCMTWGDLQPMTPAFYHKYFNTAIGVVDSLDKWVNPATDPINVPVLRSYASGIEAGPQPPVPIPVPPTPPSPPKPPCCPVLALLHRKRAEKQ